MLAYTYIGPGTFALRDKPRPQLLQDRDAIVRVTLGSICTSDLHIKHGSVPRAVPGVTVGHEMVGVVEEVGPAVAAVRPGDRVAVNVETYCGACFFCRSGWVNNCTDPDGGWALGCRIDGGQAEYVRVPYADQGLTRIPDGVTDLLRRALSPAGVEVVPGSPEATPESLRSDLALHRPQCLVAAPHQLAVLFEEVRKDAAFRNLARCVDGIQSSGDILDAAVRDGLEKALDCLVLDHYGMTETCFGGGVQCLAKSGYHLRELDLFLEILDPVTGLPVPDGETGEIVLTTLHREAMPLIRYRTGDAAAWLPGPCPCGSPLRRLAPLRGRYVDENGVPALRLVRKGGFYARTAPSSVF